MRKRPREGEPKVADYRRDLVAAHDRAHDGRALQRAGAQARREVPRRRRRQRQPEPRRVDVHDGARGSRTASSRTASACSRSRRCASASSASAPPSSIAPSSGWRRSTSAPTTSATRPRAARSRRNTSATSSNDEPSPGIAYEYQLVQQLLPAITDADVSTLARSLLGDDSRVILATSPQKAGIKIPTEAELQAALAAAASRARSRRGPTPAPTRALMEHAPAAGARRLAPRDRRRRRHHRPLRERRRGVAEADRFQERSGAVRAERAGRHLARAAGRLSRSVAGDRATSSVAGVGGLKALDLQKMLAGKIASARPFIGLSTHGISGSAAPAQLETALQLLYQEFTAPGDDPESFALMKRQLEAAVANRGRAPGAGVRREAAAGQHVESLHLAAADAGARRDARSARR